MSNYQEQINVNFVDRRSYNVSFCDHLFRGGAHHIFPLIESVEFVVFFDEHYSRLLDGVLSNELSTFFDSKNCLCVEGVCCSSDYGEIKGTKVLENVIDKLVAVDLPRNGVVVAVGGGVLMDIVGLAATLFRRSVRFIRIPTTLVGQIDAGIGIKSAINYKDAKNLLGAFAPPLAVINSLHFLSDLDHKNYKNGLAEIIKVAITTSGELVNLLADLSPLGDSRYPLREDSELLKALKPIIHLACDEVLRELKPNIFERDSLLRRLDFGHTFSPVIEELHDYSCGHGLAVAIDMLACVCLAKNIQLINQIVFNKYLNLFTKFKLNKGFDVEFLRTNAEFTIVSGITRSIAHRGGNLNLVLPYSRIGQSGFINTKLHAGASGDYLLVFTKEHLCRECLSAYSEMLELLEEG